MNGSMGIPNDSVPELHYLPLYGQWQKSALADREQELKTDQDLQEREKSQAEKFTLGTELWHSGGRLTLLK